jgi:hypothetical protein
MTSEVSPGVYAVSPFPKARSRVLWASHCVCSLVSGSSTFTLERSLLRSARDPLGSIVCSSADLLHITHMIASWG